MRTRRPLIRPALLVIAAALLTAGCAASGGGGFALRDTTAAEVRARVLEGGARASLVNVWSTWCDPCVEELPELLSLREELHPRGLELLLVSADFEAQRGAVEAFLRERGVDYPTYLKSEPDEAFIEGLHADWSGTLPLTLLFDRRGALVQAWPRKVSGAEVRAAVLGVLEREPM